MTHQCQNLLNKCRILALFFESLKGENTCAICGVTKEKGLFYDSREFRAKESTGRKEKPPERKRNEEKDDEKNGTLSGGRGIGCWCLGL